MTCIIKKKILLIIENNKKKEVSQSLMNMDPNPVFNLAECLKQHNYTTNY